MADVLIVDDDESIRETIDMVLQDVGFACRHAESGDEALRLLRSSASRVVVVLDLMMPRISGHDVLEAVAADSQRLGRHAYILLTAVSRSLPQTLRHLLKHLDVPVMDKPFDIEQLVDKVSEAAQRLVEEDDERVAGGVEAESARTDRAASQVPSHRTPVVVVLRHADIVRRLEHCQTTSYQTLLGARSAIDKSTVLLETISASGRATHRDTASRYPRTEITQLGGTSEGGTSPGLP